MELRLRGDGLVLEHLLHEINASSRPVELIAQELIRRTRGGAETAVHAGAQDRFGLSALRRVLDEIREMRFHA